MTANLLRAALYVHQHRLSAEQASLRDCIGTEAMFFVYYVGEYATHDVVRKVHNSLLSEFTVLQSRTMPGRLRLRAYDRSCSSTSQSETALRFKFSAPGHIATASVPRHLTAKQSHVLQKVDAKIRVAEEKREK
jgi:hypothetical protein